MSAKAKKKAPAKHSAKKKKAEKADAKAEEMKGESAAEIESEPSPEAFVIARHEYSSQERRGKGFSFGELSGAGLTFTIAKALRVPVDVRRRSVLEPNVGVLKGWYKPAPKKAKEPKAEKKETAEKPVKKTAKKAKKE